MLNLSHRKVSFPVSPFRRFSDAAPQIYPHGELDDGQISIDPVSMGVRVSIRGSEYLHVYLHPALRYTSSSSLRASSLQRAVVSLRVRSHNGSCCCPCS